MKIRFVESKKRIIPGLFKPKLQPRTFQPQTFQQWIFGLKDISTLDFSTMNFLTPGFKNLWLKSPGLKSSWLKSLGLKGQGLKLGVEMSFNGKIVAAQLRQILVNFGFKLYICDYFIQTAMLVLVPVELRRLLHDCHANFGFVGKKTSCF